MIKEITEEIKGNVINLYLNNNLSIYDISKNQGIGERRVSRILKTNNIKIKRPKDFPNQHQIDINKIVNDNRELIIKLYKVDKLSITDIAKQFGIHIPFLWQWLKNNGIAIEGRNGYKIDEKCFETMSYETAYWLGFLFADGFLLEKSNCIGMNLSIKDEQVLYDFKDFVKSDGKIFRGKLSIPKEHNKVKNSGIISTFRFCNKKIADDLRRYGLKGNKSLTLEWPNIEEKYYYSFLRGYIDGDGCICIRKDKRFYVAVISAVPFLLKMVDFINADCGIGFGIVRGGKSKIHIASTSNRMNVIKFLDRIYADNEGFPRLDRKYQKYLEIHRMIKEKPIDVKRITSHKNTINLT